MLDEIIPLTPAHFFAFGADCHFYNGKKGESLTKNHLLPDLSSFHGEKAFAEVFLGWNEKGIFVEVHARTQVSEVHFPDFQTGDAVELFIDTRDVKTSGFNTRFCHHFFFLPEGVEVEGEEVQAGELTRFRTEDAHELCDRKLLIVECEKERKGYHQHIFIPSECLHGYDPQQFNRLGFTYKVHRAGEPPQFFSASSEDFSIEQQPSLWASLKLVNS